MLKQEYSRSLAFASYGQRTESKIMSVEWKKNIKILSTNIRKSENSKYRATLHDTCASACTICSFIFSWDQRWKFISEIYLQAISVHVCAHRVHKVPNDFTFLRRLWCSCPEREHVCMRPFTTKMKQNIKLLSWFFRISQLPRVSSSSSAMIYQ